MKTAAEENAHSAARKETACEMNYGKIKNYDVADGPGVRVSLFVSGCRHHCKGCFQPETWDFNYGSPFTEDTVKEIIGMMAPDYIEGFTCLGGEPFDPSNQPVVVSLLREIRSAYPQKNVWVYTGYTYETDLHSGGIAFTPFTEEMLDLTDVLVDGEFIEEEKDLTLRFRGSRNQRLLDLRSVRRNRK